MNTFKRKSLYAALAGLSALGATTAAEAVNVNPEGLGQVLIYPYYTTRADAAGNAYNSLLSVVNSTSSVKAVKVRFLEGKNSREVLDFNLFLSPYDVWTTAILPSASGGARIITTDRSCTLPIIPAGGVDFVNFAYTGSADDKGGTSLDRTKEGYVEIIEMATYSPGSDTAERVTHDPPGGTPPGCDENNDSDAAAEADAATGGLFGGMTLINVGAGTDYTQDAVAIDGFYAPFDFLYTDAGSLLPNLTSASSPATSVVFNGSGGGFTNPGGVTTSTWPIGREVDAVSTVLMHSAVLNEYVLDAATRSGTDWVVTAPTKRFYVNVGTGNAPLLFQRNFNSTAGACDDVTLNIYDREERTTSTPLTFSPPPPTGTTCLPWEANVITFNNSNVLASTNNTNISTPAGFQNGWLRLSFIPTTPGATYHRLTNANTTFVANDGTTFGPTTATYLGLPVVGFAVQSFTNGSLTVGGTATLSNYGGNFVHKYDPAIQGNFID
jgi:hypothetical protein